MYVYLYVLMYVYTLRKLTIITLFIVCLKCGDGDGDSDACKYNFLKFSYLNELVSFILFNSIQLNILFVLAFIIVII